MTLGSGGYSMMVIWRTTPSPTTQSNFSAIWIAQKFDFSRKIRYNIYTKEKKIKIFEPTASVSEKVKTTMTNREFFNAIVNANLSDEITAHAKSALEKLDNTLAARKNKPSKTQLANAPLIEAVKKCCNL